MVCSSFLADTVLGVHCTLFQVVVCSVASSMEELSFGRNQIHSKMTCIVYSTKQNALKQAQVVHHLGVFGVLETFVLLIYCTLLAEFHRRSVHMFFQTQPLYCNRANTANCWDAIRKVC